MIVQLNSLILENFQVFKHRTEIPISALTLLYGPNSAGKSAVHDALLYIDAYLSNQSNLWDNQFRWSHNGAKDLKVDPYVDWQLCIRVHATISIEETHVITGSKFGGVESQDWAFESIIHGYHYRPDNPLDYDPKPVDISIELKGKGIKFFIEDACVLTVSDENATRISKFTCTLSPETYDLVDLESLANKYNLDSGDESIYSFPCGTFENMQIGLPAFQDTDGKLPSGYLNELCSIANFWLEAASRLRFAPTLVDSDRGTIKDSSLAWLAFSSDIDARLKTHPSIAELAASSRDSHFALQVKSSKIDTHELLRRHSIFSTNDNYFWRSVMGLAPEISPGGLNEWVNHCLSDHLFLDQGYQINWKIYDVIPSKTSGPPDRLKPYNGVFMTCNLIDHLGRSTTFEDVGTGVSCLIPVLIALHKDTCFIQQPELHVHPALQAALGDVCVNSTQHTGVRHIIETHSEHMLLRILKRIRQTHLQINIEPELKIQADDVCVLYFNPLSDGTTTVRRLRITEDGEFMDRWPRGFFAERDQELLDE
jgi:hypothetical protein